MLDFHDQVNNFLKLREMSVGHFKESGHSNTISSAKLSRIWYNYEFTVFINSRVSLKFLTLQVCIWH